MKIATDVSKTHGKQPAGTLGRKVLRVSQELAERAHTEQHGSQVRFQERKCQPVLGELFPRGQILKKWRQCKDSSMRGPPSTTGPERTLKDGVMPAFPKGYKLKWAGYFQTTGLLYSHAAGTLSSITHSSWKREVFVAQVH